MADDHYRQILHILSSRPNTTQADVEYDVRVLRENNARKNQMTKNMTHVYKKICELGLSSLETKQSLPSVQIDRYRQCFQNLLLGLENCISASIPVIEIHKNYQTLATTTHVSSPEIINNVADLRQELVNIVEDQVTCNHKIQEILKEYEEIRLRKVQEALRSSSVPTHDQSTDGVVIDMHDISPPKESVKLVSSQIP